MTGSTKVSVASGEQLIDLASKFPKDANANRKMVTDLILAGKMGPVQYAETLKYFKKVKGGAFDQAEFEKLCGISTSVFFALRLF